MKAAEVKKLRDDEITAEAKRLRKQLFDLRAQTVTEKTKDSSQFKKTRKDLARVLTERSTRMKKATK
jgi:ribosomal protein L29